MNKKDMSFNRHACNQLCMAYRIVSLVSQTLSRESGVRDYRIVFAMLHVCCNYREYSSLHFRLYVLIQACCLETSTINHCKTPVYFTLWHQQHLAITAYTRICASLSLSYRYPRRCYHWRWMSADQITGKHLKRTVCVGRAHKYGWFMRL